MFDTRLRQKLALQKEKGLYRNPPVVEGGDGRTVTVDGRTLVNFASNDYLGLGRCEALRTKAAEAFSRYGTSSSSSRLVSGNGSAIREAEKAYADYFGYEDAVFFPSGYQANLAILSTLFGPEETLLFDKHVHASTVKGMQLGSAPFKGFRHNSMGHLEKRLKSASGQSVVVTESLFSMDGDTPPLAELSDLKETLGFLTVVDEAHAYGAMGIGGRGIARGVADVALGTFGKAMGLFGAFVLLPSLYREYLFNFASPLIYTTALPEAHAVTALSVLSEVEQGDDRRERLSYLSRKLTRLLTDRGFTVCGEAHILAVQIGSEERAQELVTKLFNQGYFAFTARFPTVPMGQAIIRLSLTANHTEKDLEDFSDALAALDR
ncbi:aminotransferase class I/II-fold pyridoxal phosphate-dependent enzyme [Desulfoluna butyratoxydans]|uniref:8-amino-7-oxononanoate synthase n=1 Tax=Desulfoluna butyratoxydans TaxID=231438 RepID=A0A4U8YH79_9BACT|nr:8-amino-7-oxononanoate synthase [Desulfoluna butyratoxydans]VFQ42886.1 pyridoxal phosphate-dependent transferase [Desulfoluna butyratoxydans]